VNSNWAHLLEPEAHDVSDTVHERHLATHRFDTGSAQQKVVNALMDVAMRTMTLRRDVLAGLEWSINEITDNVLNHSECPTGGLIQLTTFRESQKVAFAVGDSGRGILSSLREGYPMLRTDAQAIGEAVKAGVTRSPEAGQGNGLAGTLRIASMASGSFAVTLGCAQLSVFSGQSQHYERGDSQHFHGTLVSAEIGAQANFRLAEALGFSGSPRQPVDLIELHYETSAGDALLLRLEHETTGFGSRASGRQIRTKCHNLLAAEPSKPLIIDWNGIPLVSSSFADELIGKLFVELGPTGFSSRVRDVGMEATVRVLVDRAIMQRVAQTLSGSGSPVEDDDDQDDPLESV